MAGVSRLQYATQTRLIRVMCSGRVDLGFVLRAFSLGMDGVFIGGCRLNECNYVTHGNYAALSMVHIGRRIMKAIGIDPNRLRIAFMSSGEGNVFVDLMNTFGNKIKELGPIGKSEGMDESQLAGDLEAVTRLLPYIKLVERERLRVPVTSEEGYRAFFDSDEFDRLFGECISEKIDISRMISLLRKKPLATAQIAESLGLAPSEVSRHLNHSSRQGLVRYDEGSKRFALA